MILVGNFWSIVYHFFMNMYNVAFLPFIRETFIFKTVSKENWQRFCDRRSTLFYLLNRYFFVSMSLVWIQRFNNLDICTEFKSRQFFLVSNVLFGGIELTLSIVAQLRVRIKRIEIAKCDLFFHYCNAKEISFYYFRDTKLCAKYGKTQVHSIYIVGFMFER